MTENFRMNRLLMWIQPENYSSGIGYQTVQGLYAIGSGGLFGKGLGKSLQKLGFIPESQNDMIFSIICEELGLFGAMCIILVFALMLWRIIHIAQNAPDLFGTMLAAGVFAHVAVQVVLNIAVVTNFIPNTGVSLPFISYGGTSLLFLMAMVGMLLNISRYPKDRKIATSRSLANIIKYSFSGGFYFGKNRNKWRKTAVWQCMYPRCEKCSASGDGSIPDE